MDIHWLDGKDAVGKYIMEVIYTNGNRSYMKNESFSAISEYRSIILTGGDVASATIFSPAGEAIVIKTAA